MTNLEKLIFFSFNKASIKFTEPFYVWFGVIQSSSLLKYEWCYEKMQPYFGEDNLEENYIDKDSYIFSFKQIKGLIEVLKHLEQVFAFSDLDPFH